MEVHKPRPIHSWRELASEIAVVVIGIAIALSGEQVIETLRWDHRVREAEGSMRRELAEDTRDAYFRLTTETCARQDLDHIQSLLVASRDHGAPVPLVARYSRPLRAWLGDAWANARALQIASHISQRRVTAYSSAYFFPSLLRGIQPQEREAVSELNTLTVNAGRLAPAERDRLFVALMKARELDRETTLGAWYLIHETGALGLRLTLGERRDEMAKARTLYGDCVTAPDLAKAP
ncbi:MAG: hypothetical protein M3T55_03985 [Pseudomonadota bacterium]|nr:hypothetical protein [Pseudomonadota bacterium]